jgi:hypothetical protein
MTQKICAKHRTYVKNATYISKILAGNPDKAPEKLEKAAFNL